MDKLNWITSRVGWGIIITLLLGSMFGVVNRCSTANNVSQRLKNSEGMTIPSLVLLDGEKPTVDMIKAYEDAFSALKERCRESNNELLYMTNAMAKKYENAGKPVGNYEAMRRFRTMAKSRDRKPPVNCTAIYSYFMNAPSREIRERF
jgi:hypothetical protein